MPAGEQDLTCQRLAVILLEEGYLTASYGIGRRGNYLDQALVLDRWNSRWVICYTELVFPGRPQRCRGRAPGCPGQVRLGPCAIGSLRLIA